MRPPGLAELTRAELATLVPELLLVGHLIDRAGMPMAISSFGLEGMRDIAIDEWRAASPLYTRRMQQALGFEGDDVATIFKGIQIDIGAPPQFMDFRFRIEDRDHGEFWLDHCGALMDVEPLGDDYVVAMCHDIEDPTFDATAIATNPRARVRPIHRPPRTPTDRHPHCAWTVTIDPSRPALPVPEETARLATSAAATLALAPIDPGDEGRSDYAGVLLSDLRFEDWSRSALVRIAEEVCLQGHLLALGYRMAVAARTPDEGQLLSILRAQLTGIAGLGAERIRDALDLGGGLDGAAAVLALHPVLGPAPYVGASVERADGLTVRVPRTSPAMADGAWPALLDAEHLGPLDALVRGVDPHLRTVVVDDGDEALLVEVVVDAAPAREAPEVALTRYSTGADFRFAERAAPVVISPRG